MDEEEDIDIHISYRCNLYVGGDPPHLMAIEGVYPVASMIHTVPFHDDFARMVIKEVRHETVEVLMPTSEVILVEEALGTFIVWRTHLLKAISKNHYVYCPNFS